MLNLCILFQAITTLIQEVEEGSRDEAEDIFEELVPCSACTYSLDKDILDSAAL